MIDIEFSKNKLTSKDYFSSTVIDGRLCLAPKKDLSGKLFLLKGDDSKIKFILSSGQEVNLIKEQKSLDLNINFELDTSARVNFVLSQENNENVLKSNLVASLEEESCLNTFFLSASSKDCQNNQVVDLNKDNATANLKGLYISENKNSVSNEVLINHKSEYTYSDQLFKGVLLDSSKSVFKGRVCIERQAQKSESAQLNKNLLLSASATAVSMPELEVFADDVSATHGSTVGDLDGEKLFYLLSRGIPKEEALKMLAFGFVEDVIDKTENSLIREYLQTKATKILSKLDLANRINL